MLAFPPQDWGMLRPSLDSHQHKTGFATIRTRSSGGRKRRSDTDTTQRVCAVYSHERVCVWLRAPRHGRQSSPLRFFLLSGLTKVDGDVDCFSMTAAVWPLGWTVCKCPPAMFGGKYHLTPCTYTTKLWNKCTLRHYLLSQHYSRRWERRLKPHSGGITCWHSAVGLQPTILAQAASTPSFYSFIYLLWLQLCLQFMNLM